MQFRVPQFIDIEDKVVGPLTLKQFGYILGAGGFSFLIWTFIPIKIVAIILILAIVSLFLSLAFVKINNRPFADLLESAFAYYTGGKVYTWKQPSAEEQTKESSIEKIVADTTKEVAISKASRDRLHDLSLGLDVFEHPVEIEKKEGGI
ncbi:MAG: PrgI family protein [Candidatus Paceibacterota bacterium]|jgi:hypothetical protein